MSKKVLVIILMLFTIAIAGSVYYIKVYNSDNTTSYVIPKVLEPYIKIQKNENLAVSNQNLNSENKEWYYCFDLYNYDEELNEFSELEITPYVKIIIKQEDGSTEIPSFVSVNLFSIKDISLGLDENNLVEITQKGEAGSNFEEYFECNKLNKYDKENQSGNIAHYVAKISLNTDSDEYIELTDNISQKLEILLGYKHEQSK